MQRNLLLLLTISLFPGLLNAVEPNTENQAMGGGEYSMAIFAGGCFWCVESDFDKVPGVIETVSGYMGGQVLNPTYQQVSAGGTGHTEVVRIKFDPKQVSYVTLLNIFWRSIDPTTVNRQFCDSGDQYRSAIFYQNSAQQKLAEKSKSMLDKTKPFPEAIVTEISVADKFYRAEEYHQNYYKKNPIRYQFYRYNCGRDKRLKALWG